MFISAAAENFTHSGDRFMVFENLNEIDDEHVYGRDNILTVADESVGK